MDYLEYQNYLAHARGSFGARVRKRISGAKKAGSKILAKATSGNGSAGGKSGRKWKKHKYIAIINGRYIYPAKQTVRERVTKKGRQSRATRLSKDAGRAQDLAVNKIAIGNNQKKEADFWRKAASNLNNSYESRVSALNNVGDYEYSADLNYLNAAALLDHANDKAYESKTGKKRKKK